MLRRKGIITKTTFLFLLLPFLVLEPFISKVIIYSIPLFILLAFIAEMKNSSTAGGKMNAYILITSLYLLGILSEGTVMTSILVLGLVFSFYSCSIDTI
ncbi:hypothetical protein [Jeotgalibacillus proteolyticus]|uniref:Uncharacterized protein n=1 Tax=Jeotgalibacillus proteolyticus TaxID=2082395 RepID=A0A2S5GHJ8_9BACL|nr:hypothetical protein [Jeotgalibacillus proteolyticus]PPA72438.1 hypothetical protein C4B60_03420 [Jeotgalibacillus proteolyticus]